MTMLIPGLTPYTAPYEPATNITPFTYRDGQTYLEILHGLRCYITDVVTPYVDLNFATLGTEFQTQVNTMIDTVNAALASEGATVTADLAANLASVNAAIAAINAPTVNDPIMHDVINNIASATRVLLNSLYVPRWLPNTVYAAGALVVSPTGEIVSSNVGFTSAAAYNGANWNAIAVPKWRPATTYVAGQQVISPNNAVVSAIANHISGATFTPANWNLSTNYVSFDANNSAIAPGMSGSPHNVAIGSGALSLAGAGLNQVAIGYKALGVATDNGTGLQNGSNVAVGPYALSSAITNQCTAVGSQALQNLVGDTMTGVSNNAFGDQALLNLINGNNNNAFGVQALAQCTGQSNSAFGHEALQQTTSGASNSALGFLAGLSVTTGNLNTLIGTAASYQGTGVVTALTTGSSNVFVGANTGISGAIQVSNSTAVGKGALVGSSQATAVGSGAQATGAGSVAIGVDSGGAGAVAATNNLVAIGTAMHTVQVANLSITNAATQTTAPAAGGAAALPATPVGYMSVTIGGTARKVAYY